MLQYCSIVWRKAIRDTSPASGFRNFHFICYQFHSNRTSQIARFWWWWKCHHKTDLHLISPNTFRAARSGNWDQHRGNRQMQFSVWLRIHLHLAANLVITISVNIRRGYHLSIQYNLFASGKCGFDEYASVWRSGLNQHHFSSSFAGLYPLSTSGLVRRSGTLSSGRILQQYC